MPVRPAVAGVLKHQLMWFAYGEWLETTLFVKHPATPTQAMVDADRGVITAWCTATWRPKAYAKYQLRRIKTWSMETATPTQFEPLELYPLTHITGTYNPGYEPMPPAVTVACSLRTGAVGAIPKPISGTIFHVGGMGHDMQDGLGHYDQSWADDRATIWTALKTAFTNAGNIGQWVVISFFLGGSRALPAVRAVPLVMAVDHIKASNHIAIQRRRLPRQQAFVTN